MKHKYFITRTPNICDDCSKPIKIGDKVVFNAAQEFVHYKCPVEGDDMKEKFIWFREWFWAIRTYGLKYAVVSFMEHRQRKLNK